MRYPLIVVTIFMLAGCAPSHQLANVVEGDPVKHIEAVDIEAAARRVAAETKAEVEESQRALKADVERAIAGVQKATLKELSKKPKQLVKTVVKKVPQATDLSGVRSGISRLDKRLAEHQRNVERVRRLAEDAQAAIRAIQGAPIPEAPWHRAPGAEGGLTAFLLLLVGGLYRLGSKYLRRL